MDDGVGSNLTIDTFSRPASTDNVFSRIWEISEDIMTNVYAEIDRNSFELIEKEKSFDFANGQGYSSNVTS